MSNVRDHEDACREITQILNMMKNFVAFHRRQIQSYLATVVAEGHRSAVRLELRSSSNECLTPVLTAIEELRRKNIDLGACRGPLREYFPLVGSLDKIKEHIELIQFIEPPQILI